ncbi:MAG TPA: DUF4097 family beta strand repeat-containing protein [Bacteroidota bacterium]|nr:DUF4097 family beta strand repeat-containing protein [Bacteroidota bacterium]
MSENIWLKEVVMKLMHLFAFLVLSVALLALSASAQEVREISKMVPLNSDGRLSIDTYKGSITITTWDKKEVEIFARIEPDDQPWSDDNEEDIKNTEVRISASTNEVRVKSDYDRLRRHRDGFWGMFGETGTSLPFVHYTIKMPRSARLSVKDYKSKTKISNLSADVEFNTYKGEVEISNFEGAIDLETYKGEVDVVFSKFAGSSRFETYKGDMRISLPRKSGFELDSDFGRRTDFTSDFDVQTRYRDQKRREADYYGSVNGGGPRLQLKSEKGTFRLRQS